MRIGKYGLNHAETLEDAELCVLRAIQWIEQSYEACRIAQSEGSTTGDFRRRLKEQLRVEVINFGMQWANVGYSDLSVLR